MRLPGRATRSPGTSLGPVVARFLSAPGPWPREMLRRELCRDLETAANVEAVMHARLAAMNPVFDPSDYGQANPLPGGSIEAVREDLADKGAGIYYRGERPGAVDLGQVGGWRALRDRYADNDEGTSDA